MADISSFSPLIHQTPSINEPTHYMIASVLGSSLDKQRAQISSFRDSTAQSYEQSQSRFLGRFVEIQV